MFCSVASDRCSCSCLRASLEVFPCKLHDQFFVAVLLCWVTQDFELYAAFDPLADKVLFMFMYLRFFFSFCFILTTHILADLFCYPNIGLSTAPYGRTSALPCPRICPQWRQFSLWTGGRIHPYPPPSGQIIGGNPSVLTVGNNRSSKSKTANTK